MNDLIEREAARLAAVDQNGTPTPVNNTASSTPTEEHIKSPLKKALHNNVHLGRGAVRLKKNEEELKQLKVDQVKSYWSYWNNTFTCSRTPQNRENPARLELNEQIDASAGDTRHCILCKGKGEKSEAGRLLFFEPGKWVHVNCVIWNPSVTELKVSLFDYSKLLILLVRMS